MPNKIRNLFEEFRFAGQNVGQGVGDGIDLPQFWCFHEICAKLPGSMDDEIIHQIGFLWVVGFEVVCDEAVHAACCSGVASFGDQVAAFQGAADPGPAALQELWCRLKHLRIGPFDQFLQPGPGDGVRWHGRGQSKNLQGAGEGVFQVGE